MYASCLHLSEQKVKAEELGEEGNRSVYFIHEGPSPLCGKLAPRGTDRH